MMQIKLPKNKNELLVVGLAVAACVSLGIVLISLALSLQDLNAKLEALQDLHHRMKIFADRFNEVRAGIMLISPQESSRVLESIISAGDAVGVDFQSIEAQKVITKKKAPYQRLPIDIKTRSGYQELGEFLAQLHRLDTASVIVDSFEVIKSVIAPEVAATIRVEVLLNNE
jgi:Tfp pilus assembly protein PilO